LIVGKQKAANSPLEVRNSEIVVEVGRPAKVFYRAHMFADGREDEADVSEDPGSICDGLDVAKAISPEST
jgi:hypothetical protein